MIGCFMGRSRVTQEMMTSLRSRLLAIAGMVVVAGAAHGSLIDATVLIDRSDSDRTLTIRYSGAAVTLVELRVNGVSVDSKNVSDSATHGETDFKLERAAMEDGENKIEIRVYDAAGKLVGNQSTTIYVDRAKSGPVTLSRPTPGATVTGPVELEVKMEQKLDDVYVSFFVNDEFMALKNYAPYTFVWDTNRYPNGWHEVQAMVLDGRNNQYRTQKIRVFVNNATGGRTDRVTPKPVANDDDLPVVAKTPEALELEPASNDAGTPTLAGAAEPKAAKTAPTEGAAPQAVTPTGQQTVAVSQPVAPVNPTVTQPAEVKPVAEPTTLPAETTIAANPTAALEPVVPAIAGALQTATETTKPVASPTTVVAPMMPVAPGTGIQTVPDLDETALTAQANLLAPMAITFGQKLPDIGSFTILYNNSVVSFDVSPRVEKGIPLTPFRHLFEFAGGSVTWENATKTVLADGFGRHIWLRIGNPFAKVDTATFELERAPFIESGRTIVPLSFIRETLDVDVQFDPNTGHVLVTSTKG